MSIDPHATVPSADLFDRLALALEASDPAAVALVLGGALGSDEGAS